MIGEAGPEAIIPLSGTNKYRGIELWQQVGEMLGTIPKHAQGGIFGLNSSDVNNKFGDALGLAGTTYDRLDDISTVTSKANVYKTFLRPLLGKVPVLGSSSKWMSKTMAKTGGKFGSFTKKLPWVGTALQLGGAAYDVANSDDKEKAIARNVGQITATALGAKALPAIGAILGTLLFPGLGTSVGFAGGAAIAAGLSVAGAFLGNMIGGGLGEGVYNDYKSKKLKEALQGKKRSIADISKSKPTGTPKGSRIRKHATGGIFNDPHIGMIGEAGAEAVIPLSGANKEHGKHLWSETGSILGMNNKVDEGQVQHPQTAPITINLGGMSFTFTGVNTGDNASIIAAVREQMPTIANEMCETIAAALQKVFGNMAPGEVGSV